MKNVYWFREFLWKCVVFALVMYGVFFVLRVGFVLCANLAGEEMAPIPIFTYIRVFFYGFLYDGKVVGILTLIFFVLGVFLYTIPIGRKILHIFVFLCIVLSFYVSISEIWFYHMYGDTFNTNLFYTNEQIPLLLSLWEPHISWKLFLFLVGCVVFLGIMRIGFKIVEFLYQQRSYIGFSYQSPKYSRLFILLVCLVMWEIFSISGVGTKNLKVHTQDFLQKSLPGSIQDITQAYKIYRQISHSSFGDYSEQSPTEVVKEFFGIDKDSPSYDLQTLLQKSVNNPSNTEIEHIFYIVVDGLSDWYCNKEFDEIEVCSELKTLVSQGAFKANVFLESASTNIASIETQISGLFDIDIPLRLVSRQIQNLKTALPMNLKALGYKNYLFSGASLEQWQKLDEFIYAQGFEKSFYDTNVIQNAKTRAYQAPYEYTLGAYNHHLLSLVRDRLFVNYQQKTFNLILTTPHSYDESLESFGVPLKRMQAFLQIHPEIARHTDAHLLSHIYHQDKILAKFIRDVSARFTNTLFVITGSHSATLASTLKVKHSVPFILYAPNLQPMIISNVGSHIDIIPTILELIAPNGFKYMSFGTPLLSNKKSFYQTDAHQAFGNNVVANDRFIYDGKHMEYFAQGLERDKDKNLAKELFKHLQQARALSWWIFKNGYEVAE
ncbi:LTA synthase family protein [uncultured Helicobacter sp.]|uniref:LTA synthase family protein n=1 Tax=uncultured Helicobacter sp. TaxID=175537 RepID=UPI00374F6FBA